MGRDQAAARRSRRGGHPRSHATSRAATVTTVIGAAATMTTAVTVHLASQAVHFRACCGPAGPGRRNDHRSAPSGRSRTSSRSARDGGQGRRRPAGRRAARPGSTGKPRGHSALPGRAGRRGRGEQAGHDRRRCGGCPSGSARPRSPSIRPGTRLAGTGGHHTSASATCPGRAPTAERRWRSLRHHACPSRNASPACRRESDGQDGPDVGQAAQPWRPGLITQADSAHPGRGEPAPGRAGADPAGRGQPGAAPPDRHRTDPLRPHAERGGEQVVRGGVHLPGQGGRAMSRPVSRIWPASLRDGVADGRFTGGLPSCHPAPYAGTAAPGPPARRSGRCC